MKTFVWEWPRFEWVILHLWGAVVAMNVVYRPLAGVPLVALGVVLLVAQFSGNKPRMTWRESLRLGWPLLALFVIYAVGVLRSTDHPAVGHTLELKSTLVVVPLLWLLSRTGTEKLKPILFRWLLGAVVISGVVMVAFSVKEFIQTGDHNVFFYHDLTPPVRISPIYFAWYIVFALLWFEGEWGKMKPAFGSALKLTLMVLLMLTTSKVFVAAYLIYTAVVWFFRRDGFTFSWKHVAVVLLVGLLSVPFLLRIGALRNTDPHLVFQNQYSYDTPFNGLTLRLVQLRLGVEVLNGEGAWLFGVGPARSKDLLDDRYRAHNMYTGNPELGDVGLLAYNYHNQCMETLAATGLAGFAALCALFILLFARTNPFSRQASFLWFCFLFMFTESFLERQQGITLFTLLTCLTLIPHNSLKMN